MKQLFYGRNAVFAAVGIAAVGIAVGLIVASIVGSSDKPKTTATTEPGVTLAGVAESSKLLAGIPQRGNVLGKPDAPVTMVEFADIQCPFCAQYAVDALPATLQQIQLARLVPEPFRQALDALLK